MEGYVPQTPLNVTMVTISALLIAKIVMIEGESHILPLTIQILIKIFVIAVI